MAGPVEWAVQVLKILLDTLHKSARLYLLIPGCSTVSYSRVRIPARPQVAREMTIRRQQAVINRGRADDRATGKDHELAKARLQDKTVRHY